MSLNLNNKLALITGAANGIGLATANLFASRGADLALADLSIDLKKVVKDLEAKYPNRVITSHIYDLTSSSNVENLFDEIQQSHANYQHPTILVNSAGIGRKRSFLEIDEIEYDKMMDINFKGTFLVTQGLIRRLIANYPNMNFSSPVESYASIVNVSSVVGKNGGPGFTFHSITKPGVDGFSRSVAKEFGDCRIRCNAVLPYFIESQSLESEINFERKEFLKGLPALKRFGEAKEVADVVYFLASDASSFITGTTIEVNGGF